MEAFLRCYVASYQSTYLYYVVQTNMAWWALIVFFASFNFFFFFFFFFGERAIIMAKVGSVKIPINQF